MSNSKLYNIYSALDADKIEHALNLINKIDEKNIKPQFINGYNSLKIRLLIRKDNFEEVIDFFEKTSNLMSRDYIDLVKYLDKIQEKKYRRIIDQCIGIVSKKDYPQNYKSLFIYLFKNLEEITKLLK